MPIINAIMDLQIVVGLMPTNVIVENITENSSYRRENKLVFTIFII